MSSLGGGPPADVYCSDSSYCDWSSAPPPPPPLLLRAPPPPPPPRAPSFEPSICSLSAVTFSLECFWPSFSQRSSLSRPSIKTGEPLLRYSLAISAVRPHSVISTKVTSSTH